MSYKCTVFGHKYGDTEVNREREEDGDEVIITVRETEECRRCGETRVVSENKEVTTLETAADIVANDLAGSEDSTPADQQTTGVPPGNEAAPTPAAGGDVATESVAESTGVSTDEAIPEAETDSSSTEMDPETDDGVILDDDDDDEDEPDEERAEGEWPEESGSDEGTGAEPAWPEEHEGETPSPSGSDDPSWELPGDIDPHPETEERVGGTTGTLTVPEGEFYCPDCEFTAAVESSSLRAGDYCPDCHMATLEHRRD